MSSELLLGWPCADLMLGPQLGPRHAFKHDGIQREAEPMGFASADDEPRPLADRVRNAKPNGERPKSTWHGRLVC